jgi:hypothetical protein
VAAPAARPVSDPHAALNGPGKLTTAQEVRLQLARDYPPGALGWVDGITWTPQPVIVALRQVDMAGGDTAAWAAAKRDKPKIAEFIARLRSGVRKPVVLIRHPGSPLLYAADGHTRLLACQAIGQPATAWVGTAKTDTGGWTEVHARKKN